NATLDLTHDIQYFTNTVHNRAVSIEIYKEGMKTEVKHVRKKQLSDYLPSTVLKSKKKSSLLPTNSLEKIDEESGTRKKNKENVNSSEENSECPHLVLGLGGVVSVAVVNGDGFLAIVAVVVLVNVVVAVVVVLVNSVVAAAAAVVVA
ncbi:Poly(A) polymerase type 3, partial [Paramuricea clavata]